jgi:replicative DNA helicase
MNSYTEISPSGTGVHILFLAPNFKYDKETYYIKNPNNDIEIYVSGNTQRYMTLTGNTLNNVDPQERTPQLNNVLQKYMKRSKPIYQQAPQCEPLDITDEELLNKAMNERGGKFAELWEGDISSYPSHSEADIALCLKLAFWTGKDARRIDKLFRQSGLYTNEGRAQKWDTKRGGETYGEITIKNALNMCTDTYKPKSGAFLKQSEQLDHKEETMPQNRLESPYVSIQQFNNFVEKIQTESYKPLQTGLQAFDRLIGGGVCRQSLVVLSAAPGAGKTALASQIFETMAKNGNDVSFLNLEMSREYLLARSLSRILWTNCKRYDMSANDILRGYQWSEDQRSHVLEAVEIYRNDIAPHIIYNPHGNTTNIQEIKNTLDTQAINAINNGKEAPVVVLDYLHLVSSSNASDAQEIVKQTTAMLKEHAVKYGTFVFAIAANNRESNNKGIISQSSGRDSSALEYTADIQLALNYKALAKQESKPNGKKYDASNPEDMKILAMRNPREMLIQVLKSRMSEAGGTLELNFDAKHSLFTPIDKRNY